MFQIKVVEKIKTHILHWVTFFRKSCHILANVENIVEQGRPQMTMWGMCNSCWIPKATNTHTQVCNAHCFTTATKVARTRLNVTLYVSHIASIVLSRILRPFDAYNRKVLGEP